MVQGSSQSLIAIAQLKFSPTENTVLLSQAKLVHVLKVFTLIPLLQEKSRACQSDFQMEGAPLIIRVYKQTKLGSPEAALTWPKWGTIILEFRVEEESQVRITYFNWKVIRQEHQQTAVEIEKP